MREKLLEIKQSMCEPGKIPEPNDTTPRANAFWRLYNAILNAISEADTYDILKGDTKNE